VAIDPKKIFRVTFNEITPKAIRAAFDKPRQVDTNLVDAQQARRVLDACGLQSFSDPLGQGAPRAFRRARPDRGAAADRRTRNADPRFVPQEYWTIHAMLDAGQPPLFEAKLFKHKGEDIAVSNQDSADKIIAAVSKAKWQVASVATKRKEAQSSAAFHDFQIAAGGLQPAALHRQAHHVPRAETL